MKYESRDPCNATARHSADNERQSGLGSPGTRKRLPLIASVVACATLLVGTAQAAVDLGEMLDSRDFVGAAGGATKPVLRTQVVTDKSDVVSGAFNSSWLRVTHTGEASNALRNVSVTVQFPPLAVGRPVLVQGATRQVEVPASGELVLSIPVLDRGFTAEVRIPKASRQDGIPEVTKVSAEGFANLVRQNGPTEY